MKKLVSLFTGLLMMFSSYGQWTNGTNINNTNSGNVGIGTTNPTAKLNVFGDIKINATTVNRWLIFDAVSSVNLASLISFRRDNLPRWQFGASSNGGVDDMDFFRYSNTGGFLGTTLKLERSTGNAIFYGNVAIGTSLTSNPNSYKLAVNGKIGAKEVQVENTSATWPDYVFYKTYNLPLLSEVAMYVQKNRHLPDVPSAGEVEKNGHNLGEMDAILLKKIEELTLYIIEQERRISELETQLKTTVR